MTIRKKLQKLPKVGLGIGGLTRIRHEKIDIFTRTGGHKSNNRNLSSLSAFLLSSSSRGVAHVFCIQWITGPCLENIGRCQVILSPLNDKIQDGNLDFVLRHRILHVETGS
jgi:hypothetical protein